MIIKPLHMSASNITCMQFDSCYGHAQDWNFIYNYFVKKAIWIRSTRIFMRYSQNQMIPKPLYFNHCNTQEHLLAIINTMGNTINKIFVERVVKTGSRCLSSLIEQIVISKVHIKIIWNSKNGSHIINHGIPSYLPHCTISYSLML